MILALILFILTYILLLTLPNQRWMVALGSALLFVLLGIVSPLTAFQAIDWNIIMMLGGTMGTVWLFIESKMPTRMAEKLLLMSKTTTVAIIYMCLFAGVISAFVDNVATVLMVAPVGIEVAKKCKVSPIPAVIAISVSSNLQGAATLVGDTTSILLGSYAHMGFNDFFWMQGKPGIFFAVELGTLATIPVLMFLFRNKKPTPKDITLTEATDVFPTVLLCLTVVFLIVASMFPNKPVLTNGLICEALSFIGSFHEAIKNGNSSVFRRVFRAVDWRTLTMLGGLFIVVQGLTEAGVISAAGSLFTKICGTNLISLITILIVFSVACSAFVDNIPFVASMLPIVSSMALQTGLSPEPLYFALLVGATLGGNLTPVGASANITGIGILRQQGLDVQTKDFLRIGVPLTLTAVLTGYLFILLVWC